MEAQWSGVRRDHRGLHEGNNSPDGVLRHDQWSGSSRPGCDGGGFAAGMDDDRHGSSGDWILGTFEMLFLWQVGLSGQIEKGKFQDQDPEVEEQGSHQETSLEGARGSSQETKRGFPGSSKQEVKNQDPQEEAEGPTEGDQVRCGPTIGQDSDRQDNQPGPRRVTSSLERLHGREVACRTIGAHGRLQDVLVPVGALEDPARRRYFKNMAEQSWRRHYFLERREEIERGGLWSPFRLCRWLCGLMEMPRNLAAALAREVKKEDHRQVRCEGRVQRGWFIWETPSRSRRGTPSWRSASTRARPTFRSPANTQTSFAGR